MKTKTRIHHSIIPESEAGEHILTVYYQVKPNNKKEHIRMHTEDEDYIYHWLNRINADMIQKQIIEPDLYMLYTRYSKDLPMSGYTKKRNSFASYISGLLSNKLRNPGEDFTVKHLKHIELCFNLIYTAYNEDGVLCSELGYDHRTGSPNEPPLAVRFVEV